VNGIFQNKIWMWLLVAPQLLIVFLFFLWPAIVALRWSFFLEQPFGLNHVFVGLSNYERVLTDPEFYSSLVRSVVFMLTASISSVVIALLMAIAADRHVRLSGAARNFLIWPKAVAGAMVGVVFKFILNPYSGVVAPLESLSPGIWQPGLNSFDANVMINIGYIWTHVPAAFLIFLAGLQSIPDSYHQAAAMDGAGPFRRIWDIQLPLLTPQIFLAVILEFSESLKATFALIDTMTQGGPSGSTTHLVYKIYADGFRGLDLSGSSTISVLLMLLIIMITVAQFRLLGSKVSYER
jgi:sn-glycerol 3-phosphate transport system permease protein